MEWNELITMSIEEDEETRRTDLVELFEEPERKIVEHDELVYLRGLDYGPCIIQ